MAVLPWIGESNARWSSGLQVSLVAVLVLASCLSDPLEPSDIRILSVLDSPDTLWVGAPGEPMAHQVRIRVYDAQGRVRPSASLRWRVQGRGASLGGASTSTDIGGEGTAQWVLGTNAQELQVLTVTAQTASSMSQLVLQARETPHIVARVSIPIDTTQHLRVGDSVSLQVNAIDPYGNVFPAPGVALSIGDTTIATLSQNRVIGGPRRGRTMLRAMSDGVEGSVPLSVAQYVSAIIPDVDTLHIGSVGVSLSVPYTVRDDRGRPVVDTAVSLAVGDSGVVRPNELVSLVLRDSASVTFLAVANGSTQVTLSVPGVSASLEVIVAQVPAAITATLNSSQPIVTLPAGATLPLACTAVDSNGHAIPEVPVLFGTKNGTIVGGACSDLRVAHSGIDTLILELGGIRESLSTVIAVPPVPDLPLGQPVFFDSLLPAHYRWTPSARRNSAGAIELYMTQYPYAVDSGSWPRGDLYRFVSADGVNFKYDGMALQHGDDPCGPDGSGIENMVIARRNDGPGWRMFFAGGSWGCYGWQVFSAVSTDERNWVKEPGIRLSNGGELFTPPTPPSGVPWPVGEGLVIDQLPDGRWRMITASFEHVLNPAPDSHWQISQWQSDDQVSWTYTGIILGTSGLPAESQGSVYSPSIVEFAPGLYRMFFTGDNRRLSTDPHSELWSAVSTDKRTWQVEGQLIGEPGVDVYYATAVGDRLYFLTNTTGQWAPVPRVSRLQMP
jgi:hypothetical protein